jgi:hypothetical protein
MPCAQEAAARPYRLDDVRGNLLCGNVYSVENPLGESNDLLVQDELLKAHRIQ